jgi:hypothetical protein
VGFRCYGKARVQMIPERRSNIISRLDEFMTMAYVARFQPFQVLHSQSVGGRCDTVEGRGVEWSWRTGAVCVVQMYVVLR